MDNRVLVLDAAQRSALSVVRSLGRAGLTVYTADAKQKALAGCSRYSKTYLKTPSPEDEPNAFLQWLEDLLAETPFSMVLPVTEVTSQLLLMNQERFPSGVFPFARYEQVMAMADKGELMALADELGIPYPATRRFAKADELKLQALDYPCVIKPCLSRIYTGSGWIHTRVKVVENAEALEAELAASPYLADYPFMIQAFVPGSGAGVFYLYGHGQPVANFAHRRVREKPPQGGVSVLSESVAVNPELSRYAELLLDHCQWHGVAMVEFRVTPDGQPYLMEVNTRFWGSLQLAVDAGVDFPLLLWQVHQSQAIDRDWTYRIGQRLRWWLGDLDSLYIYCKGPYSAAQKLRRLFGFLLPSWRCRHEVNRFGDLKPAWYELTCYIKQLVGR
ncbi:carboxylate--amine ligase [Marinimicrobium alkaliphilum]|uniref:carboxylate--amine ligase n=1 Tax=Marinimicrobium alkaliphilum TaxID=2202654 RepID=UPI000DB95E97|nr:ATP-grasp domain-containing protein [Marinimicrobium alkaliphilum]